MIIGLSSTAGECPFGWVGSFFMMFANVSKVCKVTVLACSEELLSNPRMMPANQHARDDAAYHAYTTLVEPSKAPYCYSAYLVSSRGAQ
jgi:hypothetical protein